MQRTPVNSTNLCSVGYDSSTRQLEIEFHDARLYLYDAVPSTINQGLMHAPSHGRYFNRHIRDKFTFRRLR